MVMSAHLFFIYCLIAREFRAQENDLVHCSNEISLPHKITAEECDEVIYEHQELVSDRHEVVVHFQL